MSRLTDASAAEGPWYELAKDAPPAWTWDEYEPWLAKAWGVLLEEGDPNDESIFQTFLERHPCLVPGGDGSDQSLGGHHGGWRNLLISQPPLPGITRRVPDFMWLSKTSEDIIPVLVEIEAPGKRWLTKGGDRTADLTHAEGQLAAWNRRLDDPASRQMFADLYDFPSRWATEYNLEPRFVLIYGRRTEFEGYPDRNLLRRGIRERGVAAMTFDRLSPLAGSNNSVCVKIRNNRPVAIAIPPTFRLGPGNADEMAALDGLDDAIRSNSLITDERRRFLLERLPYWKGLAAERERGGRRRGYRTSDWE